LLNFDLNVSILLREYPFLERFDQAARLGFRAVEFWWPGGEDLKAVARRIRDNSLGVALVNFEGGDIAQGERGLLNHPTRAADFRAHVPVALELAQQIGCTRLHALVGKWLEGEDRETQLERVRENLAWTARQAAQAGVTVLVEALNVWDNGPYIFTNSADTLAFLASIGEPNLKFQYDVYHMQRMEGNITATIRATLAQIGHIQIADSPGRHQPGTGELNFPFIFQAIEQSGYQGFVGLEYNPLGSSEQSLTWLQELI
jgi:hydroxypyruvate isomerase